jgi:hypothetical protein
MSKFLASEGAMYQQRFAELPRHQCDRHFFATQITADVFEKPIDVIPTRVSLFRE